MADSIKIGNLDISAFKVGSGDCKVYLGGILLYPTVQKPLKATVKMLDGSIVEIRGEGTSITSGETENIVKADILEITVEEGITEIGYAAFCGLSDTDLTQYQKTRVIRLPSTIKKIYDYGLWIQGNNSLGYTHLYVPSDPLPTIYTYSIGSRSQRVYLYVVCDCYNRDISSFWKYINVQKINGTPCTPRYSYRITDETYCSGTKKYAKVIKTVSYDGGDNYEEVIPRVYMPENDVIEDSKSVECGYVKPSTTVYVLDMDKLSGNTLSFPYEDAESGIIIESTATTSATIAQYRKVWNLPNVFNANISHNSGKKIYKISFIATSTIISSNPSEYDSITEDSPVTVPTFYEYYSYECESDEAALTAIRFSRIYRCNKIFLEVID